LISAEPGASREMNLGGMPRNPDGRSRREFLGLAVGAALAEALMAAGGAALMQEAGTRAGVA